MRLIRERLPLPENIRALVYVLAVALPVFWVASRLMQPIVERREFALWRNAWIVTTVAAFLLPDFLLFAFCLGLLSLYLHRQRIDCTYLYLVLVLAAPAVNIDVGLFGIINKIVDLTPARVLALAFLLPSALVLFRRGPMQFDVVDKLVLVYILLLVALSARVENLNHVGRMSVVLILDIALPYFVFSRAFRKSGEIKKAAAALVVGTLPFAATGVFEIARGWRVYNSIVEHWGVYLAVPYLFRDGLLRASVTSIEAIAFGVACMVGIGCLLALRDSRRTAPWWAAGLGIIVSGLLASISRGPWVGAMLLAIIFTVTARRGLSNLTRTFAGFMLVLPALLATSFGDRLYRLLPFIGSVERSNEEYRHRLYEISLTLIGRFPYFGSPSYLLEPDMQQLIQGQGMIDVVSAYLGIALEYGLVTLLVFLLVASGVGFQLLRTLAQRSADDILVRAMLATLVALLFTFCTVSSVSVIPTLYWSITGLSLGLCRAIAQVKCQQAGPEMKVVGGWR